MAASVVNSTSTTGASGTSLALTYPASITQGNLLVAVVSATGGTSFVAPAGWTLGPVAVTAAACYFRIADGTETGNVTWTWTTAGVNCGIMVNCTGNMTGNFVDASASVANGASTNYVASAVVPRNVGDLLLNVYAGNTANAITVPGGQSNTGGTTGNTKCIIAGYETLSSTPPAASTGTRTATGTSAANQCFSIAVSGLVTSGKLFPFGQPFSILGPMEAAPNPISGFVSSNNIPSFPRALGGGQYGGNYKIEGYTKEQATLAAIQRFVSIAPVGSQSLEIDWQLSDTSGFFSFTGIAAGTYVLYAWDQNGVEDSVTHTYIAAVPM